METKDIMNHIVEISKKMGEVSSIVKRHDEITFPEITNTLTRMESKQNQDILRFMKEREMLDDRIKPLEDDYKVRKQASEDNRKEVRKIVWSGIGLFVIGIFTGAFDHITTFIKFMISKL
jgi:hypothetical protein